MKQRTSVYEAIGAVTDFNDGDQVELSSDQLITVKQQVFQGCLQRTPQRDSLLFTSWQESLITKTHFLRAVVAFLRRLFSSPLVFPIPVDM